MDAKSVVEAVKQRKAKEDDFKVEIVKIDQKSALRSQQLF